LPDAGERDLFFLFFDIVVGKGLRWPLSRPAQARTPQETVMRLLTFWALACSLGGVSLPARAGTAHLPYYAIGTPSLSNIWVDPLHGHDASNGATRASAVRSVAEAWQRIPGGAPLTHTGYRICLVAGTHTDVPVYWADRQGTYACPIVIEAIDGARTAQLPEINMAQCAYVYLLGVHLRAEAGGGNVLHLEQCTRILVRNCRVEGLNNAPQETIKANQCRHLYLEDSDVSGAFWFAVDYVAVQYGHILNNHIHAAGEYCLYVKGGSAHLLIERNELDHGGVGGMSIGNGTGFEYMVAPWLHYEAHDVKCVNNIIHHCGGAGMGVWGGYNVLLAYNTLYLAGTNSHALAFTFGARSCDGNVAQCQSNLTAGGWGTAQTGDAQVQSIPNRNVYVFNNLLYNPAGWQSQWQHLDVPGPRTPAPSSNIPSPARADQQLVLRGNLIWNGPADLALGIGDTGQGGQADNPACNPTQLRAQNIINSNSFLPQLQDAAHGDYHPLAGGNVLWARTYVISNFPGGDLPQPPLAPQGNLTNAVMYDYDGLARSSTDPPGAFSAPVPELAAAPSLGVALAHMLTVRRP
jgi:uncharacterized Fe-S cluster protein YjdI